MRGRVTPGATTHLKRRLTCQLSTSEVLVVNEVCHLLQVLQVGPYQHVPEQQGALEQQLPSPSSPAGGTVGSFIRYTCMVRNAIIDIFGSCFNHYNFLFFITKL